MTAVADDSKGQTDMSHEGQLQTVTKLSMRNHIFPGETCGMTISESNINVLLSGAEVIAELHIM